MVDSTSRRASQLGFAFWGLLLWLCVSLAVATFSLVIVYYFQVAAEVEQAFATYRWNVSSRIYSDRQPIYAGMDIDKQGIEARLERLGYRRVTDQPRKPGEYTRSVSLLEIWQRPFVHPTFGHSTRQLRLTLAGSTVARIEEDDSSEPLVVVYLEPEPLGILVGDTLQDRELVRFGDMPAAMTAAVVAIEDRRFFAHPGVDVRGILRALYYDLTRVRMAQGGSTLTQQVVKNIILKDTRKRISRKFREVVMAYAIDREYAKHEILTKYLNEIYFGQDGAIEIRGVGSAARFYFGKPVAELTIPECATLAGLIHGPNQYLTESGIDERRLVARRNQVLEAMYQTGHLDETSLQRYKIEPLGLRLLRPSRKLAPYFVDLLRKQLHHEYSLEGLGEEGLAIYTSLQMNVQLAAENAVRRGLETIEARFPRLQRADPNQQLQGAAVVLRPATGEIIALVGGRDHATSPYNRLFQAKRQPGSLIKPFIYLTALLTATDAGGFTPLSPLHDTAATFTYGGAVYRPRNYDRRFRGDVPAYLALAQSLNVPAVDLFVRTGPTRVAQTLRSFGITTPLADGLATALGASEVYPIEIARAYGALAAEGLLSQTRLFSSVVDASGQLLEHVPLHVSQAVTAPAAAVLTAMLRQVIERGTANAVRNQLPIPIAAKTGTTSDGRDAWFVGYTPEILALVWVGFDDNTPTGLAGSQAALPIWLAIMSSLEHTGEAFAVPEGAEAFDIDTLGHGLATPHCPVNAITTLVFFSGQIPPTCTLHLTTGMAIGTSTTTAP